MQSQWEKSAKTEGITRGDFTGCTLLILESRLGMCFGAHKYYVTDAEISGVGLCSPCCCLLCWIL